jgi:[acyl-carrier-protein] S-malonyltransferase
VLVLVAPGQGAQSPGFLTPWLDLPDAADTVAELSDAIGLDLVHYGTVADADAIRDTAVAQPLLVAAGLLAATALADDLALGHEATGAAAGERLVPGAVAGHSVGEITAAVLAGVLERTAALAFVRERGLAMAEAAKVTHTGMAALLGGDPEVTVPHLERLGLTAANVNGAGQIVAAGTLEQLAALDADVPEGVRKVVRLEVAGAFHTHHMAPAVERLRRAAADLTPADPAIPYVSNREGALVSSGAEVVERLVGQVGSPVRWDLCMETFREQGVTALLELCPGGPLTGLAKRALRGVQTLALKTPDDLDAARVLLKECSPTARKAREDREDTAAAGPVTSASPASSAASGDGTARASTGTARPGDTPA